MLIVYHEFFNATALAHSPSTFRIEAALSRGKARKLTSAIARVHASHELSGCKRPTAGPVKLLLLLLLRGNGIFPLQLPTPCCIQSVTSHSV